MSISILAVFIVGLVLLVIFRKLSIISGADFNKTVPKSAKASNKTSRIAETVILLCAGIAIFIFTATNTSTGGRLLILDQFRPGFAATNIAVAGAAVAGVILGVLVAFLWRTSLGVLIATIVACCYGLVLNGPEQIIESLAPESSTIPGSTLTFILNSPDAEGGELWINDIYLGTLPYETTFEEFYAKVPFWPQEPNENKRENRDAWLLVPNRWSLYDGKPLGSHKAPWAGITIPQEPTHWNNRRSSRIIRDPNERLRMREAEKAERAKRTYYARVKLGNEWGYSDGGSGSSSGGGGRYGNRRATVHFGFVFPERQKRIEKLLDMARLYDYSPGQDWFEAMDSYRSDGLVAVLKAMDTEPEMSKLFDAWAIWKYGLDKVTDSKTAWQVFEKICDEAEKRQYYMTSDITGRAVELLVPRLDPEKLVSKALKTIRSTGIYSWILWEINGRSQFGIGYNPRGLHTGADRHMSVSTGGNGGRLSPSDYVIAHAVWMLDEIYDSQDDTRPNIIEDELVPAFICRNYKSNIRLFQIAAHIGGPHIERYMLRQNWQAEPRDLPWGQDISFRGEDVNGWLYLLANLKTPTGWEFRQENADRIMNIADILTNSISFLLEDELDLIFIDNDLGKKSLSLRYWPRFKALVAMKKRRHALKLQFQYLIRMEPLSTVDMYLHCWKDFRAGDETDFYEAIQVFNDMPLPLNKRERIYKTLLDHVNLDVSNIEYDRGDERLREQLQLYLKSNLLPLEKSERAKQILNELKSPNPKYEPENVAAWLANDEQTHPMIKMLADADQPELRLLVMGALREHPIPANRVIMKKLLQDSDEEVRKAAEEVASALKTLKETPPEQFGADLADGPL